MNELLKTRLFGLLSEPSQTSTNEEMENAAQNYSMLNRIALNLLKNEKTTKVGVSLSAQRYIKSTRITYIVMYARLLYHFF